VHGCGAFTLLDIRVGSALNLLGFLSIHIRAH
jgi:hypothetical protein